MVKRMLVGVFAAAVLFGCVTEFSDVAPRGGWRAEAERACMDRRAAAKSASATADAAPVDHATTTPSIVELPAIIDGPCGIDYPLKVSALADGGTVVIPTATLGCPMTEALEAWLRESVQPAAMQWIGSPVVEIAQLSNYACRKRNNFGKGYSEHAFGNALDIGGFKFANGREITMAKDWRGAADAQGFFRDVFATACQRFTTVLAPGSNIMHYNHIHMDLAIVAPDNSPKMCKPSPEGELVAAAPGAPGTPLSVDAPPGAVPSGAIEPAIPGAD